MVDLEPECRKRQIPPNLFFDYEESNPNTPAGQVPTVCIEACQACAIRVTCLDWALCFADHGFFAMTRRNARMKLRRQLKITITAPTGPPPWWPKE